MAQRVFIKIDYGSDAGPFDLFTDADGYITPFATNVSNTSLYGGYLTNSVPDIATTIKLVSKGNCNTVVFFTITGHTTTSTTTEAPCYEWTIQNTSGVQIGASWYNCYTGSPVSELMDSGTSILVCTNTEPSAPGGTVTGGTVVCNDVPSPE